LQGVQGVQGVQGLQGLQGPSAEGGGIGIGMEIEIEGDTSALPSGWADGRGTAHAMAQAQWRS
jgi:hypothetical protein|tara:strand:+ start:381 stop:569 length:189 start_codon:yes stop_codon:yes gene_type:complete